MPGERVLDDLKDLLDSFRMKRRASVEGNRDSMSAFAVNAVTAFGPQEGESAR
jgi:hypothetical protein